MTASAKIRGADKIVARWADKMIVLEREEALELRADLNRIFGVEDRAAELDDAIGRFSRMCDALSAKAMKLQRRVRG